MSSGFVHLHNHSHYSIGDAISKIEDIFRLADQYKMPAVSLTDHGNMFGVAEFLLEAKKYPHINAIVGCEMYVFPRNMREKPNPGEKNYYHFLLLAKNEVGYKNLSQLVSLGSMEGFYYRPRVDYSTLQEYSEGLIASSACLGGEIAQLILKKNLAEAEKKSLFFQEMFGKDHFFLELMNHGLPEQSLVNQELVKISAKTGVPLIATNDVHYPHPEDHKAHDIFLCIQEGKKVHDSGRKKYHSQEFFFKNEEQMRIALKDYPEEALTNTIFLAQQCSYKPLLDKLHIPSFTTNNDISEDSFLEKLCDDNLALKYKQITPSVQERLTYELSVIKKMGFASYFLIVQDFIQYAKRSGIRVGPGRGSAAGSLVAYLLGITDLEPLQYNLLFERFLNPGRISMPDIDTDFEDTKRDEIIRYVTQKYGQDRVAQIIAFGKMKAKSVIRDVGRVLDIPLTETDILAKLIPHNHTLQEAYAMVPQFQEKIKSLPIYQEMYALCLRLENLIRQTSTHAAGLIIGKETLTHIVPLHKDRKTGAIITQFEGKHLEEFGLLKMDFLGLRNLRIIQQALINIQEIHKKDIEINNLRLDDKTTFKKVFQEGRGIAVFQCESMGMRTLMKRMQPSSFEDIIALVALFRPGPLKSGMADDFIKNKQIQKGKISYPHEDLRPILESTYGVIIYQEQIMQISQTIAGFSLAEADNLRKAMGKKDIRKMQSMRDIFMQGAERHGHKQDFSQQLFDNMAKFAEYGFNKSHSAAYGLIAYQTAYLKAHYPVEYMCAVLSAESSTVESLTKYIQECKSMGIKVLPPNINASEIDFTIQNHNIRFGLSAIKNIGEKNLYNILEERHKNGTYETMSDFVSRVPVNKKILEALCLAGALDELGMNRATVIHNMDNILSFGASSQDHSQKGMGSLFSSEVIQTGSLKISTKDEFSQDELLRLEKDYLGFYATAHPLEQYREQIDQYCSHSTLDLKELKTLISNDDSEEDLNIPSNVRMIGKIINYEVKTIKNNEEMAVFQLEDLESTISMVMFPKAYKEYRTLMESDQPLVFDIRVDFSRFELQGIVNSVSTIESAQKTTQSYRVEYTKLSKVKRQSSTGNAYSFDNKVSEDNKIQEEKPVAPLCSILIDSKKWPSDGHIQIREIIEKYPGDRIPIILKIEHSDGCTSVKLGHDFKILNTPRAKEELSSLDFVSDVYIS